MGILLDSTILIDAERKQCTVLQLLQQIHGRFGDVEIALSVISVAEPMHGAYRAIAYDQRRERLAFIDRFCKRVPVHAFTVQLARTLGRIEGQQAGLRNVLPFEDLAIGVTALHLRFDVVTLNRKHSDRIPGLGVIGDFKSI